MTGAALDLASLKVNGGRLSADILDAIVSDGQVRLTETITGASTLTMTVLDTTGKLRTSRLFTASTTCTVDGQGYGLVKRAKTGTRLDLTFEDLAVARLRRRTGFRKIAAGTHTRAGFIGKVLLREEPWIDWVADTGELSRVELARGTGASDATESTWDAAGRLLGEIGWRMCVIRGVVHMGPDKWLMARSTPYTLREHRDGVDDIDFDCDTGKPAQTASTQLWAGWSAVKPGSTVTLPDAGPASGTWIVETVERSTASKRATVKLIRPQPETAEPKDTSTSSSDVGETGYRSDNHDGGTDGGGTCRTERTRKFVDAALSKLGAEYEWGHSGPRDFDCSGLVQWAALQAGRSFAKPASNQLAAIRRSGTTLSLEEAYRTRGAVLIRISGRGNHIAISLGDGKHTIEAMGETYGVVRGNVRGRGWTDAGLVPGL